MRCQRCLSGHEAAYRAVTDALDILICSACAEEARRLGIPIYPVKTTIPSNQRKGKLCVPYRGNEAGFETLRPRSRVVLSARKVGTEHTS